MKLAFVVNRVETEKDDYTTIRLARKAAARGHEIAFISLGDFIYASDGRICAIATLPKVGEYEDDPAYLHHLQQEAETQRIVVEDYDIVMLRSDPADELASRPWAPPSSLLFAQLAAAHGTIVLNDPGHLTHAQNKTYFQHFPEEVRPSTCITRDADEVETFLKEHGGKGVLKPLQGSGGQGVFIVTQDNRQNLNQIIESVTRDGYAIVQEYLPAAADGDLRIITMNGRPLQVDGQYASLRRSNSSDDHRSNISAGGQADLEQPDEAALRAAEMCAPKLIDDGMYLAGLDVVGDKMIEVNVDTPGALNYIEDLSGVDFCGAILDDLERKVRLAKNYSGRLTNRHLAVV
ncbi:MAG: glutathione synthase [Erythrobacter sp.]|uniref:glutathione synthase n=1 Tax=Erythrobacter sp. TaxID=1042 RepID=UPI003C788D10